MTTTTYSSDIDRPTAPFRPAAAAPRPVLEAARLWAGGLATAVVAALIGLVGLLVVRVLATNVHLPAIGSLYSSSAAVLLCTCAAIAALAATGLAHLLLVSTPRPLAYLGWIVGLATAAAAVLPLTSGLPLVAAVASGVINLVIGLAIGSLVAGAAYSATRCMYAR
jgi:hypothetical protein